MAKHLLPSSGFCLEKFEHSIPERPFYLFTEMHGLTSLKTVRIIFTAARTLNFMCDILSNKVICNSHYNPP